MIFRPSIAIIIATFLKNDCSRDVQSQERKEMISSYVPFPILHVLVFSIF